MSDSRLAYSTHTGAPNHAAAVARIHAATVRAERVVVLCRVTVPEPHERGEFPMDCGPCHVAVNY